MKPTLLPKSEQCRILMMLLMLTCGFTYSFALESDEINDAILAEGSIPVKWTNGNDTQWYISTNGSYLLTPTTTSTTGMYTNLTMTYTSSYPTDLSFEYYRYTSDSNQLYKLIIDGEERVLAATYSSWGSYRTLVPAGQHTISFAIDYNSYNNNNNWAGLRNLRVREYQELETSCVGEGSLPLTFTNDPDHLWLTEDGYIRSMDSNESNINSRISTTINIDKPSLLMYQTRRGDSNSCNTDVYVDGVLYKSYTGTSWSTGSIVLYPGEHKVEFENRHSNSYPSNWTEIRNVTLDQNWCVANLNNPGELGVRVLQALGSMGKQNLQDALMVKITGSMNSDDWATVRQLTGVRAIDFTEANITAIPDDGCRGLSVLNTVMLPENLTTIGKTAFYGTNFHRVYIPAAVETIGREAWSNTPLQYIEFSEGSRLSTIGYEAFYKTELMEFDMPDSVTTIETYNNWCNVFRESKKLKRVHLSEELKAVPPGIFMDCTALEEVNIPREATEIGALAFYNTAIRSVVVPQNVSSQGSAMFSNCKQLKHVVLNSHCWNMRETLRSCTALETIVLPCATPPTIDTSSYEPFYGVTKSQVKMYVPDFALESYKQDPYWYQFTNMSASDEASINDFWAIRGNLTLNSTHIMQGEPSVTMNTASTLTIDADTQQNFNEFIYDTSEANPTSMLSRSNSVDAQTLKTRFAVNTANKWFFFSPVTDVKMSDITFSSTDSWVIRYYDGARRASQNATSGNWINVPADGILKSGQGYIVSAASTGWLSLPAASTDEHKKFFGHNQVTMPLDENPCATEANAGWNFVANPYPTYYDIYYIDMQAPITVWTGSTYRAYSLNDGDRGEDTFVLRPMQPFFVQKDSTVTATGMPLEGRQINTTIDRTRAPRRTVIDRHRHKLNLELFRADNEEADDYTRIVLNEKASMAYEASCDASKFMSIDTEVAQIYSLGERNDAMAINERPYDSGSVALGVYIPAAGESYRITARRSDRKAWLHDAETGIEQDLTEGDYIFMASRKGIDNSRFTIRFSPAANAVESIEDTAIKVRGNAGCICVQAPAEAEIAVYGTDGSMIANVKAESGNAEIPAAAGVYVVKVNGQTVKTVVK